VAFESGIMNTLISKKLPILGFLGRAGEAAQGVYDNFEYNGIDDTKDVDYIFWTSLIRQGQQVVSDVASKKLTDGLNSVIDKKISNPMKQMFAYIAGHAGIGGVVTGGEFLLDNGLEFLYATLFGSQEDKERYYMDNNPDSLLEDTLLVMWEGAKSTGASDLLQFAKNIGYLTTSKYNGKNNAQLLADFERTGVDLGDIPKAERDAYMEYFLYSYHDKFSSTTDTDLPKLNDKADKFVGKEEKTDYTTAELKESTKDKKPIAIQVYENLCEYKAENVTINGETIKDTYLYVSDKGDSYAVAKVADANGKTKYITYEYIHDSSGTVQVNVKEYSKQEYQYIDQYYDNISKTN
jgi:hypothetical protein